MLRREGVKVRSNELVRSEWSPQDFQALLVSGQVGVADPDVHMFRLGVW